MGSEKSEFPNLDRMISFEIEELDRKDKLGEDYSFREIVPIAERIRDRFRRFSVVFMRGLPASDRNNIESLAGKVLQKFDEVVAFSFEDGEPAPRGQPAKGIKPRYDALVGTIRSLESKVLTSLAPALAELAYSEAQASGSEMTELVSNARSAYNEIKEFGERAEAAMALAQDKSAKAGLTSQSTNFSARATEYRDAAGKWLGASTLLLGALALYIWFAWPGKAAFQDINANITLLAARLVVLALFSYAIRFSARSYLANRHNAVICMHRSDALDTYTTLSGAATDESARDLILSTAAGAIFSHQPTGYRDGSPGSVLPADTVANMVSKSRN